MKSLLGSIRDLWRKTEREAYRAFHARSKRHKADHFLNFCIAADSLRDHTIEELKVPVGPVRQAMYDEWNADPLIVAVKEIANLTKHFRLRDRRSGQPFRAKTKKVVERLGVVADVYVAADGQITTVPRRAHDLDIQTSDGATHELWTFQIDVLDYWRQFLGRHGVRVRMQHKQQFIDAPGA